MNDRLQPILVIAATAGMIVFNYFAATGVLGGIETGEVSDKYPTLITPAGYAFSIWSLIYLGCVAFSVYQILPSRLERFRPIRRAYLVSCAANCAWLYFWSQEMPVVCLGIILILLASVGYICFKLRRTETMGEFWLAKFPFGLYFGWVTAATILNTAIMLVYVGVRAAESSAISMGAGLLLVAAALGVFVRVKLTNYFYPLAIAWALTAIAVKQSGKTLIVAAAAFGVIACLIAALSFVLSMPSSDNKAENRA